MNLKLEGKVALVTGGNAGIGRATAVIFAREGAKVVIAARNVARCEETVGVIKRAGGECIYVIADMAKSADVKNMVQKTIDTYGRLDCAVNNAGFAIRKDFLDYTEAEWDEVINVDLKGVWMCMMNEIPQMLKQGGGAIVNVSSNAGLVGFPFHAPYVAAKHGVLGLTKSASTEFAARGIRVNSICPGLIQTPAMEMAAKDKPETVEIAVSSTPMGRIGKSEELADAALWLCSDRSSYITGITLCVDGGWVQH